MPYQRPGVDITQDIRTNTPVLPTPELESCIVGQAFHWQNPNLEASQIDVSSGSPSFTLNSINDEFNVLADGDSALITVSLIGITGTDAGKQKHLVNGTGFTVTTNSGITTVTVVDSGLTTSTYKAKVGFRAKHTKSYGFNKLISLTETADVLGEINTFNPLAYAVKVAMDNSSRSIWVYKTTSAQDEVSVVGDALLLKDFHKIAISKQVTSGETVTLKAAMNSASLPENKKERIIYVNKYVDYGQELSTLTSGQKATLSEEIRDSNATIGSKRVFSTYPSWGYKLEKRHILTLSPAWIAQSFAAFCVEADIELLNLHAILASKAGTYKAGTKIDSTVWTALLSLVNEDIEVFVPVPGFYYTAAILGAATGVTPDQPLTNMAISGVDRVVGSQDVFIESDLNTMASGGTWILTQLNEESAITTRHQLSTNNLSIIEREHSITTVVDFTSKFTRKALEPHVGKSNITDKYIQKVKDILKGISITLTEELGYLKSYEVLSVTQDTLNPDTLIIEIKLEVNFPANYIKVTLVI